MWQNRLHCSTQHTLLVAGSRISIALRNPFYKFFTFLSCTEALLKMGSGAPGLTGPPRVGASLQSCRRNKDKTIHRIVFFEVIQCKSAALNGPAWAPIVDSHRYKDFSQKGIFYPMEWFPDYRATMFITSSSHVHVLSLYLFKFLS